MRRPAIRQGTSVGAVSSARTPNRRGPSPFQPYRELRRLWRKSRVTPDGTTVVYRLAPPLVAACLLASVLVVPVTEDAPGLGLGRDALALLGLLAVARFAVAASSCVNPGVWALAG